MTWIDSNCDGAGPHSGTETRRLPTGGSGAAIVCRCCYDRELRFRRERIREGVDFELPAWGDLEVYDREHAEA